MSVGRAVWRTILITGAVLFATFLLLPVVALVVETPPADLLAGLRHPVARQALKLSLFTTTVSVVIVGVLGTLLSWALAQSQRRAARWLETLVQVPIVMPPAVAGLGLLLTFGRKGLLGGVLERLDLQIAFTTAAVILAEIFVSAPFFVSAATAAFRRIDPRLIAVARSLGASPARVFFRVGLPLSAPGLVAGIAMSWARSLGEFGATIMFAGNFEGRTQTLPLAVYGAMESDLRAAQAIAIVLLGFALVLLVSLRALSPGRVGPNLRSDT